MAPRQGRIGIAVALSAAAVSWGAGCATTGFRASRPEFSNSQPATSQTANPQLARDANDEGIRLAQNSHHDRAEEAFRTAVRLDPKYAAARNNLGLVLLERGMFHESALAFSVARRLAPRSIEPVINLGRLYETVGWHKAAEVEYEHALTLDEDNVPAMVRLARVYAKTNGNHARSQVLLNRIANNAARNGKLDRGAAERSAGCTGSR